MSNYNIATGLDIGNTKIVTTIGKFEEGVIDIIGIGKSHNQGIRKGLITDIEETVSSISSSLEEAERLAGVPIRSATVGIDGPHIESEDSKGVIATSRADGEIAQDDVNRVIEAARAIPNKPNRQVLHVVPKHFTIDGQEGIKDATGMNGIRLEVDTHVISTSSSALRNTNRVIEQAGLQINDVVFSPLATAKVLLSKRQMEIGVVIVDVGASGTSYAVFEEGDLISCGVVPIGSLHITNDLAIGLRTNLDIAEILKLKYGYALPDKVAEKEEVKLNSLDKKEDGVASVKYIAEIIEARLNEILLCVQDRLQKIGRDGTLPAGVILTGGGANLEGIVELTKETLRLPAQIGSPLLEISGLVDKIEDPVYSTSIGLMLWDRDKTPSSNIASNATVQNVLDKTKNFIKQFLP